MGQYIPYIIDGVLILYLILRFVKGYRRGFIRELLTLILNVGFVVGLVLYLNPLREFLVEYIDIVKLVGEQSNPWINYLLALSRYAVVTVVIIIAFNLISKFLNFLIRKFIQRVHDDHPSFASFDRTFGFVVGLVNGTITIVILCYALFQPLFFPQYQDYFKKTQFALAVNDITEDVLEDFTGKTKDEINSMFVYYLVGSTPSENADIDNVRINTFAKLLTDLPKLVSKPKELLEVTGDNRTVVAYYIYDLSALADITAKAPEDEGLNKKFGVLYDQLVALIPENVEVTFPELEYKSMFDEKTGSFYQVGLSQEQLNKLLNICHNENA